MTADGTVMRSSTIETEAAEGSAGLGDASATDALQGALSRSSDRIHDSILGTIGNTPLVRLRRLTALEALQAEVLLKLEYLNPLGSVKDRIGAAMVEVAEKHGLISPGRTVIVEPTSGNTGIALAFVAAAKGYELLVVMPDSASVERLAMLRLLGASLELTPAHLGMAEAIRRAEEIVLSMPHAWSPRQFDNPANPAIHQQTTADEIWKDCNGVVDAVVAGAGTGGTVTGIGRALKARNPALRIVAVEPAESAVLSGDDPGSHDIQGIGPGFKPAVLDMSVVDEVVSVSQDEAAAAIRLLARSEGIPVGLSTGAVLSATARLAREPANRGKRIVAIAASSAERYLTTRLFTRMLG